MFLLSTVAAGASSWMGTSMAGEGGRAMGGGSREGTRGRCVGALGGMKRMLGHEEESLTSFARGCLDSLLGVIRMEEEGAAIFMGVAEAMRGFELAFGTIAELLPTRLSPDYRTKTKKWDFDIF